MMRGKISFKTILVLVILVLVGVLGVLGINTARTYMSGASAGSEPKGVLATPGDDGKSATISWSSDKATMGVVEYGTTPASLLLRAIEPSETVNHNISLSPLKSGINYYFRIRVGEEIFDNNGIPYSFKTKGSTETVSPNVTVVPTIAQNSSSVGGCNRTTDYNGDNVVNSLDYINCVQKSSTNTGTGSTASSSLCSTGNSLERLKCLQNSKK